MKSRLILSGRKGSFLSMFFLFCATVASSAEANICVNLVLREVSWSSLTVVENSDIVEASRMLAQFRADYDRHFEGVPFPYWVAFHTDPSVRSFTIRNEGYDDVKVPVSKTQFGKVSGSDENGNLVVDVWVGGKFEPWTISDSELQTMRKNNLAERWTYPSATGLFAVPEKYLGNLTNNDEILFFTFLKNGFVSAKRYLSHKKTKIHYEVSHIDFDGGIVLKTKSGYFHKILYTELLDFEFSRDSQVRFTGKDDDIPGVKF